MRPMEVAVVEAIADARGVEPTELEFTLYDYIDTEILERLGKQETDWHFQFEAAGHTVGIDSDRVVTVDGELY